MGFSASILFFEIAKKITFPLLLGDRLRKDEGKRKKLRARESKYFAIEVINASLFSEIHWSIFGFEYI